MRRLSFVRREGRWPYEDARRLKEATNERFDGAAALSSAGTITAPAARGATIAAGPIQQVAGGRPQRTVWLG